MAESKREPSVGAERSGLHSSDRHLEARGDLVATEPLEVLQVHHFALVCRKLRDRAANLPKIKVGLRRGGRRERPGSNAAMRSAREA